MSSAKKDFSENGLNTQNCVSVPAIREYHPNVSNHSSYEFLQKFHGRIQSFLMISS